MKPVKVGANLIIRSEISGGSCSRKHLPGVFIHCIMGLTDTRGEIVLVIMGEDVDVFVSSDM